MNECLKNEKKISRENLEESFKIRLKKERKKREDIENKNQILEKQNQILLNRIKEIEDNFISLK